MAQERKLLDTSGGGGEGQRSQRGDR